MFTVLCYIFRLNISLCYYFINFCVCSIEAELEYLKIAEDLEMYGISYFQIRVSDTMHAVHTTTTTSTTTTTTSSSDYYY